MPIDSKLMGDLKAATGRQQKPVVILPPKLGYFEKIFKGVTSLLSGMWLTLGYLVNPKKVVTQQYPENRDTLKMSQRFRGSVIMPHDDNNDHNCTGCKICEKACPNGTISILNTKNEKGKKVLGQFVYRLSQCTLCNLCIEACPFGAIDMGPEFEWSDFSRKPLDQVLNKKEGR